MGYFHFLGIVIGAVTAICVHTFVSVSIFKSLGLYLVVKLLGCKVTLCLPFLRTSRLTSTARESHFSHLENGVHKTLHLTELLQSQGKNAHGALSAVTDAKQK